MEAANGLVGVRAFNNRALDNFVEVKVSAVESTWKGIMVSLQIFFIFDNASLALSCEAGVKRDLNSLRFSEVNFQTFVHPDEKRSIIFGLSSSSEMGLRAEFIWSNVSIDSCLTDSKTEGSISEIFKRKPSFTRFLRYSSTFSFSATPICVFVTLSDAANNFSTNASQSVRLVAPQNVKYWSNASDELDLVLNAFINL